MQKNQVTCTSSFKVHTAVIIPVEGCHSGDQNIQCFVSFVKSSFFSKIDVSRLCITQVVEQTYF